MSEPLYVPVLPIRAHAVAAAKELAPWVRDRTSPLWTLPAITVQDADQLKLTLDKELRRVAIAQKYTEAWLDAPHADFAAAPYADLLHSYWSHTALRPVTGPDLPVAHQSAAAESARNGGNSLGVRVRLPGTWIDDLTERTAALLAMTDPEVRVDLLLDLQTVSPGRPDAGKEALRALDALTPLTSWRTIAALSGGFPDEVDRLLERERGDADRVDWDTWHEIRMSQRPYANLVHYGDYGALPARNIGRAVDDGDRSPFGLLRYTTERSFLLSRFWAAKRGETGATREAARWITEQPDYRGAAASIGDRWYQQCALTSGSEGTGNPTTWNKVGNIQHITYVVRCLCGDSGCP